jgi:hypothetical protein
MMVYVLNVDLDGGNGDYTGHQGVYATVYGALNALDEFMYSVEVDDSEAHDDETELFSENGGRQRYVSFVGNDLTVSDGPWVGALLSWGVNAQIVHGLVDDADDLSGIWKGGRELTNGENAAEMDRIAQANRKTGRR